MNLATIVEAHSGAQPALITDDETITYGDLRARVARGRTALAKAGIGAGDRVAITSGNSVEFVVALLAVTGAGAVAVPLNPASPPAELDREVAAVGAKPLPDLSKGTRKEAPLVERSADDLAVLAFTSGTAGMPKAAMLTHGNLLANIAQVQAHPGRAVRADDVMLGVLPFFHIFGLTVSIGVTLAAGASLVVVPHFDPVSCLETCRRHGVTIMAGAPMMYAALVSAPGADDTNPLETVRLAVSGAAPLPAEVAHAFETRFGRPLYQGYGLTEASPVVTSSVITEHPRPQLIGVPLPGVEVRLVDDEGEDALEGDPGELWIKGANVFAGYWEDADATSRALTGDGWLRTGDMAVAGPDGQLQLVDRKKDLIIVNGFNVVPAEVEAVLAEHPKVADVAVVGTESARTGEAVLAVVVPAPGTEPTLTELTAFAAERLARYKCPTELRLVEELERGQAGKLLRRSAG